MQHNNHVTYITSPPQSNVGRAHRSCTTTQQSPHWLQWDAPTHRPTDGIIDRSTPSALTLAILIESNALIIIVIIITWQCFNSWCYLYDHSHFKSSSNSSGERRLNAR